jgi:hypothetical protein
MPQSLSSLISLNWPSVTLVQVPVREFEDDINVLELFLFSK